MQGKSLKELLSMFRGWLPLLVIVPVGAAAFVGVYVYTVLSDRYTARASIYVLIQYEDASGTLRYDAGSSNNFANDFKVLIERTPTIAQTRQALGLSAQDDSIDIAVKQISGSRVVDILATANDPALAADAANMAANNFKAYIETVVKADSVSTVQAASVPEAPSGPPRLLLTTASFFVALGLCVTIVLTAELLNTKISTAQQIEAQLGQPVLGNVYEYRKALQAYYAEKRGNANNPYRALDEPCRSSVKTVAMNIGFQSAEHPLRTLAITSVGSDEGKSSLAVMIASVFAEEGKLALVVDVDFKNPSVRRLLGGAGKHDLMDYLSGQIALDEVLIPTAQKNLYYIDCRHPDALLSRATETSAFSQFLTLISKTFDIVIFDTPPLGSHIETAVLSAKLDGTVLVIARNQVDAPRANEVIEQIDRSGSHLLGVVLNYMKPSGKEGHYYAREGEWL